MIIYPAIDLIDGKAVRLEKGDYAKKTEYSDNPVEEAKRFENQGAKYLHIVDLNGAKAKQPVNLSTIKTISVAVSLPIQVGGGIRSVESATQLLKYVDRVIIGTVAITKPEILSKLIDKFGPEKIVVSVDYKDGFPAINGWLETSPINTEKLQDRMLGLGVKVVIVTDTDKDGLLSGPNIGLMKEWKQTGLEIICAGGVGSVQDIANLAQADIDGAIIGKALYEGKITVEEAINAGK